MSGYVIFVRLFPSYSDSFPYSRFAGLKCDEIGCVFEALCAEWLGNTANRRRIKEARAEIQKCRAGHLKSLKQWERRGSEMPTSRHSPFDRGEVTRPGPDHQPVAPPSQRAKAPRSQRIKSEDVDPTQPGEASCPELIDFLVVPTGTPSQAEIARVAGWGGPLGSEQEGGWSHSISDRYPVARYDSKEFAGDAVEAIRGRLAEIARGARWGEVEYSLVEENPRFEVVPESALSPGESARVREQLHRIRGPKVGTPTREEAWARVLFPRILSVLEQITAAPSGDPSRLPLNAGAAANAGPGRARSPAEPAADPTAGALAHDSSPPTSRAAMQEGEAEEGDGKVRTREQGVRQRPESARKMQVVAHVRTLRGKCIPWKEVTKSINGKFGTDFEEATLKRYLRESNTTETAAGEGG